VKIVVIQTRMATPESLPQPLSSERITPDDLCVGRIVSWRYVRPTDIERQPPYAPIYKTSYGIIVHQNRGNLTIAILQENGHPRIPETHELFAHSPDLYTFTHPDIRVIYKGDFVKEFRKSSVDFIAKYRPTILETFPIPKTYIIVCQRGRWGNQPVSDSLPCRIICPNYEIMTLQSFRASHLPASYNIEERLLTYYMRRIQPVIRHSPAVPLPMPTLQSTPQHTPLHTPPPNDNTQVKFRLLEIIEVELEASRINEGEYLAMCNLLK